MTVIAKNMDTDEKLRLLSHDSRFDLACACATRDDEHRRRSRDDTWVYPVALPQGGTTFLFKTLLSNACSNDCRYCPLRKQADARRCSLTPEELTKKFLAYQYAGRVSGLFLSSSVGRSADDSMEKINRVAKYLRRSRFKGYIHLKILPGASDQAIRESLSLATAVSLNIETAGEANFRYLSAAKDYQHDIIRPIQLISKLTSRGGEYAGVKQTTQFVVGASKETDQEIVTYSGRLYRELRLSRVYFSAYQRGAGSGDLPGEQTAVTNRDMLCREHRLYQADWLLRKYGFAADEIPFDASGNLSQELDPKEHWAQLHPEFFPVCINSDEKERLLRVPGLGQVMVERILAMRQEGRRIRSLAEVAKVTRVMEKALPYIRF